jgi:hypothetical protein
VAYENGETYLPKMDDLKLCRCVSIPKRPVLIIVCVLEINTFLLYVVNTTQLSLDGHAEIQGVCSLKQTPLILAFLCSDLQSHPIFCTSSHQIVLRSITNLQAVRPEKRLRLLAEKRFVFSCRAPTTSSPPGSLSSIHPALFPRGQIGRGVKLTTYFELGLKCNEERSYTFFLSYVVA